MQCESLAHLITFDFTRTKTVWHFSEVAWRGAVGERNLLLVFYLRDVNTTMRSQNESNYVFNVT